MTFTFGAHSYKIWYQYSMHDQRRETVCLIERADEPKKTFAAGSSICAASDQFRKEVGRKIALTRALRSPRVGHVCGYDPAELKRFRTAAWKAYLNRKGVDLETASSAQIKTMPEATT